MDERKQRDLSLFGLSDFSEEGRTINSGTWEEEKNKQDWPAAEHLVGIYSSGESREKAGLMAKSLPLSSLHLCILLK